MSNDDDITTQLRDLAEWHDHEDLPLVIAAMREAAAEIERLRAELQEFHDGTKRHDLAPEDIGMVRVRSDAEFQDACDFWRFPDEQQ